MRAYNRPVNWWGWHWSPPEPLSIVEVIDRGSMPPRLAALFWLGVERGSSLLIVAEPPLAGKTAILTALLGFARPGATAYFTRGMGETFDLPARNKSHPTYILVNEISDHLSVYTWGRYARRAFELLNEGYSLATTMHADSVAEALGILERDLTIPRRHIANLTFVAALRMTHSGGRTLRRLTEVVFLRPGGPPGEELQMCRIADWNARDDSFRVMDSAEAVAGVAAWAGLAEKDFLNELERREEFLRELSRKGVTDLRPVHEAIVAYYEGLSPEGRSGRPPSGRSRGKPAPRPRPSGPGQRRSQ
jgi:hypothetical protein